jgi:hypothetical protein
VAIKVTGSPAQTVVADAAIVTLTGRGLLTTMVIIFDVAVPVEQVRLEVNTQVILSLLTGV